MKKLLWLSIVLSLIVTSHTFAAGTLKASYDATNNQFKATLSGVKGSSNSFKIYILDKEFPAGTTPTDAVKNAGILNNGTALKPDALGVVNWTIVPFVTMQPGHFYYLRAAEVAANGNESYASAASKILIPGTNTTPTLQPLALSAKGTIVSATVGNLPIDAVYKMVIQTKDFSAGAYAGNENINDTGVDLANRKNPSTTGVSTVGSVSFSSANLLPGTKYYARIVAIPRNASLKAFYVTSTGTITTGDDTIALVPLSTKKDGDNIIVSGQIDKSKLTSTFVAKDYTVTLSVSKTAPQAGATALISPDIGPLSSRKAYNIPCDTTKEACVNDDGTYFWYLTNLSPSTVYYFQQTATVKGNKVPVRDTINNFNSSVGTTIAPGSIEQKADLNKRSYTLLSGFPNFSVLPDPDLCAQQRAAGENPQFCDMNDVINYFMKLLIGLCAVSLVFRIMYEGFVYMTSDMPFKVASAKSSLYAAILGLLLALTSYIILNTINPKLVDGTVSVNQLAIGIQDEEDASPLITSSGIGAGKGGQCTGGLTTVIVQKSRFVACSSYKGIPVAENLKKMLTAAYAQGIVLQGGGYRTNAEQIALRKAHCNGNTTDAKAKCVPPTAVPGYSNHESGLAFDFTCDSSDTAIRSKDNKCFLWLQKNAGNYGLKNFAKEAWHWSWNGK